MVSSFLEKHIVGITRFIEFILTILNLVILCAQLYLLCLSFTGTVFFADGTDWLYVFFLSIWGISIIELLFSLFQRIIVRVADPYPINRLNAVMSPVKASVRFLFRIYIQSILYFILISVFEYNRRRWLGDSFPGGTWGKFVSFWYGFTPITSLAAKEIHAKLWKILMD